MYSVGLYAPAWAFYALSCAIMSLVVICSKFSYGGIAVKKRIETDNEPRFNPPNLGVSWLISIFIAPVLVASLPYLFAKDEVSSTMCLIIGLVLLVALLFFYTFFLILKIYDASYRCQIIEFKLERIEQNSQSNGNGANSTETK